MKTLYSAVLALRSNDSIEDIPYVPESIPELTTTIFELKRRGIVFGVLQIRFLRKRKSNISNYTNISHSRTGCFGTYFLFNREGFECLISRIP